MPIETICKGCARKLRVADEFAGRKARCPHCKTVYTVPETADEVIETDDRWRVRTKDGAVYGPVAKPDLDLWVKEGRVAADAELQRQGTSVWVVAAKVYPMLQGGAAGKSNPFSETPRPSASSRNPYVSPSSSVSPVRGSQPYEPHRGGMILTFAIVGFLCCQIFSIVAWVMGHHDLKEIDAGRMDPEGRGLTQAGMIVGIIGTILMILSICLQGLIFLGAAAGNM